MKTIKVYSTPFCKGCKQAKELFKELNLTYEERDVTNPIYLEEMVRVSGQMSVPVLEIGRKILVGYSKNSILEALN